MASDVPSTSLERPWLNHYPQGVSPVLDCPDAPAWKFLEESASRFPDRVACHHGNQQLTYQEMWDRARQAAAAFARLGVEPGDRVGLLLPNAAEFITALNGAWLAGAMGVALSPLMARREVLDVLAATDCKLVVALDLLAPLAIDDEDEAPEMLLVSLRDRLPYWRRWGYSFIRWRRLGFSTRNALGQARDYRKECAASAPIFIPRPSAKDDPAYVLPTGGTTGRPKAVVLTHGNLVANACQLKSWVGEKEEGAHTVLAVLPFFHSYGLSTCVTSSVALGATLVLHHRFKVKEAVRLIERHRPTVFPAVPAMLAALNQTLAHRKIEALNDCRCMSGGAPLPRRVAEEFAQRTGATVVEGFGLSEASPVTHAGPLDGSARAGCIGLPLPGTDAKIVDAETGTQTLPPGEVGELVVRGPQVMMGYWNDPDATAKAIRDGWLHTGDLGSRDEDGFFRIVDRKKDLIITSGFNVFPSDVEAVLREFSGIADAAVVGVPDETVGELVKAVVVAAKNEPFSEPAFDAFCIERLAKYKRPRIVEVIQGDLPRNFLGKVLRRQLREPLESTELAPS
ncbi:MAG: long-chain fatty acid--CoA ligase [Planctomycetales bacterium]